MHVFLETFLILHKKKICLSLVALYFTGPISTFFPPLIHYFVVCLPETLTSSSPVLYSIFQVPTDAGVDTLIPLSLQGKDNHILQQLLPTLLNSAVLGELVTTLCNTSLLRVKSVCLE